MTGTLPASAHKTLVYVLRSGHGPDLAGIYYRLVVYSNTTDGDMDVNVGFDTVFGGIIDENLIGMNVG